MPSAREAAPHDLITGTLRLAAYAAIFSPILYIAVTLLHPDGVGNDHPAVFREYAMSRSWTAIHLLQFVTQMTALFGLGGIAASVVRLQERGRLLALLGMILAAASVPATVALLGVDGIALGRAARAWVAEGGAVGSPSFAAASAIRWFEESMNAMQGLTLGATAALTGAAMVRGSARPRWLGWIGVLVGIAVFIDATLIAETGFSEVAQTWFLARNPGLWVWTTIAGMWMWRGLRRSEGSGSAAVPLSGEMS
jgi:hypothetical protein